MAITAKQPVQTILATSCLSCPVKPSQCNIPINLLGLSGGYSTVGANHNHYHTVCTLIFAWFNVHVFQISSHSQIFCLRKFRHQWIHTVQWQPNSDIMHRKKVLIIFHCRQTLYSHLTSLLSSALFFLVVEHVGLLSRP